MVLVFLDLGGDGEVALSICSGVLLAAAALMSAGACFLVLLAVLQNNSNLDVCHYG